MDNTITIFTKASEFAPFIKTRRLALGMTQEDLAHAVNIMPHHVSRLENGVVEPKLATALALFQALDVKLTAISQDTAKPEYATMESIRILHRGQYRMRNGQIVHIYGKDSDKDANPYPWLGEIPNHPDDGGWDSDGKSWCHERFDIIEHLPASGAKRKAG